MNMVFGICRSFRDRALDRCFHSFPCLSDPARRSSLFLKVTLVTLHFIYAGIIFIFDSDLIDKTKKQPWYTALYVLLFIATLVQYFITSGSSPGYVIDARRAFNESNVICEELSMASNKDSLLQGSNSASWTKLVMDMYPLGTSIRTCICPYCSVEQPPRAKHCYDCDKCVLQFDHHCVWLGTCIGQGNHCKFWWYICEESVLCLWTGILYITYLRTNILRAWWMGAIVILLFIALSISFIFLLLLLLFHSYLVLTNQTTYELVRRRRIPYLRGIPERIFPFSKGVCSNLYDFCCVESSMYSLEPLPSAEVLEEKSRPYTCLDVLTCRCC